MSYIFPPRSSAQDYRKAVLTQDELLRIAIANDANIANARRAVKMGEVVQLTPTQTATPDELLLDMGKQESDARTNIMRLGFRDREASSIVANLTRNPDLLRALNINFPSIEADIKKRFNVKLLTPTFFLEYLKEYNDTLNDGRGLSVNSSASVRRQLNGMVNTLTELKQIIPSPSSIERIIFALQAGNLTNNEMLNRLDALLKYTSQFGKNIQTNETNIQSGNISESSISSSYESIQKGLNDLSSLPSKEFIDNTATEVEDAVMGIEGKSNGEIMGDPAFKSAMDKVLTIINSIPPTLKPINAPPALTRETSVRTPRPSRPAPERPEFAPPIPKNINEESAVRDITAPKINLRDLLEQRSKIIQEKPKTEEQLATQPKFQPYQSDFTRQILEQRKKVLENAPMTEEGLQVNIPQKPAPSPYSEFAKLIQARRKEMYGEELATEVPSTQVSSKIKEPAKKQPAKSDFAKAIEARRREMYADEDTQTDIGVSRGVDRGLLSQTEDLGNQPRVINRTNYDTFTIKEIKDFIEKNPKIRDNLEFEFEPLDYRRLTFGESNFDKGLVNIDETNFSDLLPAMRRGQGVRKSKKQSAKPLKKIIIGKGINAVPTPTYREFGKFVIHDPHLEHNDLLVIRYKNSIGVVPKFRGKIPVSDIFREFMLNLLDTGKVNQVLYKQLEQKEKKLFEDVSTQAGLFTGFGLPRTILNEEAEELKRFEILRGEIMGGNNNPKVYNELRRLVVKFINDGRIKRRDGTNLLMELSI